MARKRTHKIWSIETNHFREIVGESLTLRQVLASCGCGISASEYKFVRARIKEDGLDTKHFRPYGGRSQSSFIPRSLEETLVEGSNYNRGNLKRRLLKENLIKPVCNICKLNCLWNGKTLVLVLDHINGVNDDNRLENLQLVCPNCNSQLDTFSGRNIPGVRRKSTNPKTRGGQPGVARTKSRRVSRPPYEKLCQEIEELGYSAVGRRYGVSDNAIRKWKSFYELR